MVLLTFQQNHNTTIALSVTEGGQTPLPISMGGMAGFAPLDPPLFNRNCNDTVS